MALSLMEAPTQPIEVVVLETFRISGRGVAAMLVGDPQPWWQIGVHKVRVVKPDSMKLETIASVELALRSLTKGDVMTLLFPSAAQEDLPMGSHVTSIGIISTQKRVSPPRSKWWQIWRR